MIDDPVNARLPKLVGIALIIALVGAYVASSFRRYFVNDDYQLLYTAWQRSRGLVPGRDFYVTSFSPLFDLFIPGFRAFPTSLTTAYAGRIGIIACLAFCAFLVSRLARTAFGEWAGILAPVFFIASAPVIYRGTDLRPDVISTALFLLAFVILTRERLGWQQYFWVGVVVGLALVNRFKSVIVIPPVGALVIWRSYDERRAIQWSCLLRPTALVIGGALIPAALCVAYLVSNGTLASFAQANFRLVGETGEMRALNAGLKSGMIVQWIANDPLLMLALGCALRLAWHERSSVQQWGPTVFALTFTGLVSVVANPAYYAYNLVTLTALIAPIAAWAPARLIEHVARRGSRRATLGIATACLVALPLQHAHAISRVAIEDSASAQRRLLTFLVGYTPATAHVFAMEGVGLFRPSSYHWRLPGVLRERYEHGEWSYRDEWATTPPEVIVLSYRVLAWLTEADRNWIAQRYTPITDRLLVPGHRSRGNGAESFTVMTSGQFRVVSDGPCLIDGRSVSADTILEMAAGPHSMEANGTCDLQRPYPPSALTLIRDRGGFEYLYTPELSLPDPVLSESR